MQKKIAINSNSFETRIALIEDSKLKEIYIERHQEPSLIGNIYVAKVSRVIPGIQSSFIEIEKDNTAFLYGGDALCQDLIQERQKLIDDDSDEQRKPSTASRNIETILSPGQVIPVQISKDPLGTKGARATMDLSIAGRFLVLTPYFNHIGISRRITDETLREQLKQSIASFAPEGLGFIIRTAAAEATSSQLESDVSYLVKIWTQIEQKINLASEPKLIYSAPNAHIKVVRDIFTEGMDVETDSPTVYNDLKSFFSALDFNQKNFLKLYSDQGLLFDKHNIETQINDALKPKVWLPSGGYLVIDHTEALCAFDINTGKFTGNGSVRDTILHTNLEAAKEIAAQLRLRNIGGIVVIDFIDMEAPDDQEKVVERLIAELANDRARTNVLSISELGLLQMTRKRTSDPLITMMSQNCQHCFGEGLVKSYPSLASELFRTVQRYHSEYKAKKITVQIRDDLLKWINKNFLHHFEELEQELGIKVIYNVASLKSEDLGSKEYSIS